MHMRTHTHTIAQHPVWVQLHVPDIHIGEQSIQSVSDRVVQVPVPVQVQVPGSVVLGVSRVGAQERSRGPWGGQHTVLVEGVQGGATGQGGAVLEARWGAEGRRALVVPVVGARTLVVPEVGARPVGLQLGEVHELGGHGGVARVSHGVLNRPLQLHPPVLEPVSDLRGGGGGDK